MVFLLACSERSSETNDPHSQAKLSNPNELIALNPKVVQRADRLPPQVSDGSTTVRPIAESATEPGEDWQSEEKSVWANDQLAQLTKGKIDTMLAASMESTPLVPSALTAFKQSRLPGQRAESLPGAVRPISSVEFMGQLNRLLEGVETVELKPIGIEISDQNRFTTRTRVELHGPSHEINTTWECVWQSDQLSGLRVLAYETMSTKDGPLFVDVTRSVLTNSPRTDALIDHGIEYWNERITRYGDMYLTGHHGLAIGDVNGDGLEDVYVCDGGSLPNQLYIQQVDGTAKDMASASGVDFLEDSRGALLVDLDNDGDQDLVVATVALIIFAENDGSGKFTLRGGHQGAPYPASICAADPDNDGDLDIYACVYEAGDQASGARWFEARSPVPFNDANNGGRNVLLGNQGNFQFADITAEVGLEQNNHRWTFAAAWEDYDQDGDVDLAVANDFGRNSLYRNDDGKFTDIAAEVGVEDMAAGMSVTWGDYNRDGRMDLYVGNMFSSAGNRISYQRQFGGDREASGLAGVQRMARGNSLFAAKADGSGFVDVSEQAGVTMGRWAWSSGFVDMDNDGWQDLVIANGYLTNTRDVDL